MRGTWTVQRASLTVTANDATKVYGDANPAFTVRYDGFVLGEGPDVLGGTLELNTQVDIGSGIGKYVVTLDGLTAVNYNITMVTSTLMVNQVPLVVIPADASRFYGDANPAFTGTIVGIKNGDAITASYSTTATPASPVGTYDISASLSGASLGNYSVSSSPGRLTINQATLTVTADDHFKTYGDMINLTGTISGQKNGDEFTASYASDGAAATAIVGSGCYAINVVGVSGGKLYNYNVVESSGTLMVNQRRW